MTKNNPTNHNSIAEQIDYLTERINYFSTLEGQLQAKITALESELTQKTTELEQTKKEKKQKLTELTQTHQAENEILKKEINQELATFNKGATLREAVNKFLKQHCRNERHIPTFTDKCLHVVGAPFNWVANKTSQGFALFGFCSAVPSIFAGLGWMLKAYLTVKTGGLSTVASSMLNQGEKTSPQLLQQQGGYIAPQPGNLPGSNQPVIININNPNEKEKETGKK